MSDSLRQSATGRNPGTHGKIVAIIQARMSSTRLYGKVLEQLSGLPLMAHVIERVDAVPGVDEVVVATTKAACDRAVMELANQCGAATFAGSEDDVLDRYYQAARQFGASIILRFTADCPLLDPHVSQEVLTRFLQGDLDYSSNIHPPTYPDGLDTEVISFSALERAWREAKLPSEHEHVTSYIWNHPELFCLGNVSNYTDLSEMRWTVDEREDLELVSAIMRHLPDNGKLSSLDDVLDVLARNPDLRTINSAFDRNEGYVRSIKKDDRQVKA